MAGRPRERSGAACAQIETEMLTPKQQRFVAEYLIDLNATQAAARAGYSARTANEQGARLLAKASVQAAVASAQEERSERTELTQDWVLNNLRDVAERSMQAKPVLDRKGKPVMVETAEGDLAPAFVFDSSGANRSLELLGKHLGMFKERVEHSGAIEHSVTNDAERFTSSIAGLAAREGVGEAAEPTQH